MSFRNICPSVPTVPQKQPTPPLSLRYPSVNDRNSYCKGIARVLEIKTKNCLRISSSFLCSATGNRTPVYGVRGRCPRPLDDSTVTVCRTSFSKASAKVLLFFDMTKYFEKKMQFFFILLQKSFFFTNFAPYFMHIWVWTQILVMYAWQQPFHKCE